MPKETIVKARGLTKAFKGVQALDGLSLDIRTGISGLIGPNGAGKTTLLRVLLGLIKPDAGSAEVLGLDTQKESLGLRRRVGVLHERPTYPGGATPKTYLRCVGELYGGSRPSGEVLELVGLSFAADRKIRNLSAGMLQRLGIAQALVGNPELVFLDEPTSNLDVVARDDILQSLVSMHEQLGVSFLIASHILSELERVCHEVALISSGRIIEQGATWDIIQAHTTGYYKIVSSDAKLLAVKLLEIKGILKLLVTGVNSVTIQIPPASAEAVKSEIERIAAGSGVKIHAFHQTYTLEDAYRGVMRDG